MPQWVINILVGVLTGLLTKIIEKIQTEKNVWNDNADVDARLNNLRDAYKESFNGEPVTPEQREKLKKAIREFISGGPNGGL